MLIVGFDGTSLPDNIANLISQGHLTGVILFARNYVNLPQLKSLTEAIGKLSAEPIFIAVDQEGGRVVRFTGDFPTYPSPLYYGSRNDARGLMLATRRTASCLKQAGVNLNLLPVCDLAPNDENHVIHSRSYCSEPAELAKIVAEQIGILRSEGILSCAKHFPGLVSAYGDPHLGVSRSDRTLANFRSSDYLPFHAALGANVDLVMITHLLATNIDPDSIATFSESIINRELRKHLHFEGLVISDDLLMAGALEGLSPAEAGIRAITAGCDLLIYGSFTDIADDVIETIAGAADSDKFLRNRVQETHGRITQFRQSRSAFFDRYDQ